MNDANNWNQKWALVKASQQETGAVCLSGESSTVVETNPFVVDADEEPEDGSRTEADVKARLWSYKIPSKLAIQCVTMMYKIHHGPVAEPTTLSLLQRQEG